MARFALLLAALLLPLAAGDMTRLHINVKNLDGKPIDRASVIVRFAEPRSATKFGHKTKTSWELRTNQEGIANIPQIPQGKVQVQVIAASYQTFGANFEIVQDEQTIEIALKPPQPQYSAH
jgi:hypothetical protein